MSETHNEFSEEPKRDYVPLLPDLEPLPHSLLWMNGQIENPGIDPNQKSQLEGQRELLKQSQSDAWAHLEDFKVPMSREELLRYADIAGKTGDFQLINRLNARIFYDREPLIPDTVEDMKPFNRAAAATYRHRAIELRMQGEQAKAEGNIEASVELFRQAEGAHSLFETYAMFAGDAYGRPKDNKEKTVLSLPLNLVSKPVEASKIVDLFFESSVVEAYEELWSSDLQEQIIRGDLEIPGVDRGWLNVFSKQVVTDEGNQALINLQNYLINKHGITREQFDTYSSYRLQEFFGQLSNSEDAA